MRELPSRRCRRRRGQATLEFAFCLPLFLVVLFGALDAGLWAMETNAGVSAAEEAARIAASAPGTPAGNLTHPGLSPAAADVTAKLRQQLQQAMFGTQILPWCDNLTGAPTSRLTGANCPQTGVFAICPSRPQEVSAQLGERVVVICVQDNPAPPCAGPAPAACAGESPSVTVRVIGFVAALVPPALGLGWRAGEIPIDLGARTHTERFNP